MATELIPARPNSCSLYELEDTLQALVNTIDLAEDPSVQEMILDEIGQTLQRTKEKRDRVVAFLRHCEQQQEFADAEVERIQKRKRLIARVHQTLESYLVRITDQFAEPDRRGVKRLEGNFSSMRLQRNPESVVITDDKALPVAGVSTGIKRPHLYRFCSCSKKRPRRRRGTYSKIVSKFCLASGRLSRYDRQAPNGHVPCGRSPLISPGL